MTASPGSEALPHCSLSVNVAQLMVDEDSTAWSLVYWYQKNILKKDGSRLEW